MIRKKCFVFLLIFAINLIAFSQTQSAMKIDSVGVVTFNNKIKDKNGITYDPLPIGTILMYSGVNWVDDATLPGWMACTAANYSINTSIPNLENTFIMGTTPQVANSPASTRSGGNNEIVLTEAQLPRHAHTIDHDHPNYESVSSEVLLPTPSGEVHPATSTYDGFQTIVGRNQGHLSSGSHSHNVDLPLYSGTSGETGSGAAIDIRPKYYSVIYIIKVQ